MDEISSREFRKTYAKLTVPTTVTANGRPIGLWTPAVVPGVEPAPVRAPAEKPAVVQPRPRQRDPLNALLERARSR